MAMGKMKMKMKTKKKMNDEDDDDDVLIRSFFGLVGPLPRERHRWRVEFNGICPMAPLSLERHTTQSLSKTNGHFVVLAHLDTSEQIRSKWCTVGFRSRVWSQPLLTVVGSGA